MYKYSKEKTYEVCHLQSLIMALLKLHSDVSECMESNDHVHVVYELTV